jgi:CBS domain-containing protein
MPIVISSKVTDITTWRPAADFRLAFRQALLDKTARMTSGQAEMLFLGVRQELEQRAADHDAAMAGIRRLMEEAATTTDPAGLGGVIREFYGACYALFAHYRSAPAFYRLSEEFLGVVAKTALDCAMARMGLSAGKRPPVAVVALGSAGRREFSPFCKLQLALVHEEAGSMPAELGQALHDVFAAIGLRTDNAVTLRNPDWCRTLAQWRKRLMVGMEQGASGELVHLLRLADQSALLPSDGLAVEFNHLCLSLLRNSRATLAFMVTRILGLSNGIGIMGGLRLERSGPYRGRFALFDHALFPFSASVAALTLLMGGVAVGVPQRIRELLASQKLNVEQAERLLETWHTLHGLRLDREGELFPSWNGQASLYLDPETLPDTDMKSLREALEIVAVLQRHVAITFSGWEEQTAC